jgi:hypothetical protein
MAVKADLALPNPPLRRMWSSLTRGTTPLIDGWWIINFGAVLQSSVVLLKALFPQMRVTLNAIDEFDCEIERRCRAHADYPLLAALLCAGSVFASRLLAALGTQRARFACAQDLRWALSGVTRPLPDPYGGNSACRARVYRSGECRSNSVSIVDTWDSSISSAASGLSPVP